MPRTARWRGRWPAWPYPSWALRRGASSRPASWPAPATAARNAPAAGRAQVQRWIDDIAGQAQAGGGTAIPGQVYARYDSELGRAVTGATGSTQHALGELRQAMRRAMDRSISPAD